jgi:hypothetical protein
MNFRLFLLGLCTSLLLGCRPPEQQTEDRTTEQPASQAEPAPSLSPERIADLARRCDFVDYVFYYANFSLSQDEPGAVRQTVTFIGPGGITPDPDCRPMGRIFFQEKGEILLEGDMYFQDHCRYFLFLENGKPKYAHAMTPAAVTFLQQIFQRAQQSPYGS